MIAQDPKSAEIIRPILRGRDIKRYGYNFADLWLINTHNGIKEKQIKLINVNDYPAIKKHLNKFLSVLEKRIDQGNTPYNLRNCAYMEDFFRPKIIWKRVGSIIRFCYDEKGFFSLDSTCFAIGKHIKYITGFLNSVIGQYQLINNSPKTGTGDLLISVQAVEPILVPVLAVGLEKELEGFINKIIEVQNNHKDPSDIEIQLEKIIFDLYQFNNEEINFLKNKVYK